MLSLLDFIDFFFNFILFSSFIIERSKKMSLSFFLLIDKSASFCLELGWAPITGCSSTQTKFSFIPAANNSFNTFYPEK